MKKLILSILLLSAIVSAAIFFLSGFRSSGPESVVFDYLEAIKAQDTETMQQYYPENILNQADTSEGIIVDLDQFSEKNKAKAKKQISDFEYTIGEPKEEKGECEIPVEISTYNLGLLGWLWLDHCTSQVNLMAQNKTYMETGPLQENTYLKILANTEKDYKMTVTFHLQKKNKWKIEKII